MTIPLIPIAASLIAEAVPGLLKVFGKEKQAEVAEKVIGIARQVSGIEDPKDAALAIIKDPAMLFDFKKAIMAQQTELEQIGLQRETLYVSDVQDARKYRDDKVFRLGIIVLMSFVLVMGVALWGIFAVVTGQVIADANVFAAVIGLVGAIIGYFAANAQQVVSYFFGSSAGSMQNGDRLADAIKSFKKG
jgi:ABC-type multidrug transport system fused ATPase/permease subunit